MPDVDFSRNAGVYDRRHGARLHEESARALTAGLPPAATILDIGAGTGRVSLPLAALGFRVVALDPAVAMIEVLRGKAAGVNARPVRADGRALPFSKASFDAAVVLAESWDLIAGWRDVLREAIRDRPGRPSAVRMGQRQRG